MKKIKDTVWSGKPNFKKLFKDQRKIRRLKVLIVVSFLLGFVIGVFIN